MGKIHLEGADNARDLGGLKTTEGAVIREKKLIRSNRLSKLTQNDMNLLSNEYHLHKILDLRTPMEVEQEADLEIQEASYMNIPFFMESMVGVSREKETKKQMLHMQEFPDMKDIYIMMIQNKFCNQQITKAVREVMTYRKWICFMALYRRKGSLWFAFCNHFIFIRCIGRGCHGRLLKNK